MVFLKKLWREFYTRRNEPMNICDAEKKSDGKRRLNLPRSLH
jgi:hypothetical protein